MSKNSRRAGGRNFLEIKAQKQASKTCEVCAYPGK